jgi:hypothetical protein
MMTAQVVLLAALLVAATAGTTWVSQTVYRNANGMQASIGSFRPVVWPSASVMARGRS